MDLIISSATHRSGSTLLQRLFNARDKTLIWGENGGCLIDFSKIYKNTLHFSHFGKHRAAYFNNGENPNKWIACMTPPENEVDEAMIETIRVFHEKLYVENYKDQNDFFGYKEVRYGRKELLLLRKCYPDCIVILLVRNPIDVWKSIESKGWEDLYGSLERFTNVWNNHVRFYLKLSKSDPKVHFIKYEDLNAQKAETLNLIKQIGDLQDQDIQKVLAQRINSSSTSLSKETKQFIEDQCGPLMKKMGYMKKG